MDILKIGFSYPFPDKKVLEFIKDYDEVFVVEEVDPIMEKEVLSIIGRENLNIGVHGKLDGTFPECYEFNSDIVSEGFNKVLNLSNKENIAFTDSLKELSEKIPSRAPVLCAGWRSFLMLPSPVLKSAPIPTAPASEPDPTPKLT